MPGKVVKVTVELWIDYETLCRNERDAGFDMEGDAKADAEALVAQNVDSMLAMVGWKMSSSFARKIPDDAWKP